VWGWGGGGGGDIKIRSFAANVHFFRVERHVYTWTVVSVTQYISD